MTLCSAGVGRTGTFIALDILSNQLAQEQQINVFETVYKMRLNRTDMVQSLVSYYNIILVYSSHFADDFGHLLKYEI